MAETSNALDELEVGFGGVDEEGVGGLIEGSPVAFLEGETVLSEWFLEIDDAVGWDGRNAGIPFEKVFLCGGFFVLCGIDGEGVAVSIAGIGC